MLRNKKNIQRFLLFIYFFTLKELSPTIFPYIFDKRDSYEDHAK